MSRITDAFRHKAFIPFVTAGDPNLATTKELIREIVANGADIVEIGIPFSDPVAEGPAIQKADERALANGINTDDIFGMVAELRTEIATPFVFMTYINPVFVYGIDKFMARCSEVGIDGIIIPDVPFEEKHLVQAACRKNGVTLISMVAPSSAERIAMIAKEAEGFLYVVSSLGVTGVRSDITTDIGTILAEIRKVSDIPCAVGFGISNAQQAKAMSEAADGVIIGSAIINIMEKYGEDSPKPVGEFVAGIVDAIRGKVNNPLT